MKEFNVSGMNCAACSARVEKAVSSLEGVDACSVNLLTNSMTVEGSAPVENIIVAVENAGYGAELKSSKNGSAKGKRADKQKGFTLVLRLVSSIFFLLLLMYLSMGHTMWNFPLPSFLSESAILQGIAQMLLSAIVLIINKRFFISGFKGIINRAPNMDTLVALGSGAAFVYSVASLFSLKEHSTHDLYFEGAAMILTLITVGKLLEARAKGKTTNAIRSLMELAPKTAIVIRGGKEVVIAADELKKDDIFIVKAGGNIPADAVIIEGSCSVDESALTGESLPVEKGAGDRVSSATVTKTGYVKCRAERVGEDTTLSQIIKMVESAAASKAPIAKIADKVSGIFVPVVLIIAAITTIIWLLLDKEIGFALIRGISVLVISCPCALGLAT
ncbi:MAG: heavy metal translocating P-type ATPase, partial [Oscillospiraceae bacterium]|nr:heavy metal translocating P-type ATPase [Oscillospiraceae bacterium]